MSDTPSPGTLLAGRYAVGGVLGAGSQAETLEAVDEQSGKAVAIKRFQVRGAKSWKDVELAEREARVLATLSHPNLPVYVAHFEQEGALYLVMEKIEGVRRWRRCAGERPRSRTTKSRNFLRDADGVLCYLHSRAPSIIHRDIKPGNVIRRADGSFAFVDFGSVRDSTEARGRAAPWVGTFGVHGARANFRDARCPAATCTPWGATALALATGREPEDLPHRGHAIDVPAALGRGAQPWLVRALSAMLEPNPDLRPCRVAAPGAGRRPAASKAASTPPSDAGRAPDFGRYAMKGASSAVASRRKAVACEAI